MRIEINSKLLASLLTSLRSVIELRNTIPVLSNVLIESAGDKIKLTATDLDNNLTVEAEPDEVTEGRMCLSLDRLHALVKALPASDLTISLLDNKWAEVLADSGKFKIMGVAPENFPEIPHMEGTSWECEGKDFLAGLSSVAYAMGDFEEATRDLRTVLFEVNGSLRFVACDGHSLSLCEIEPKQPFLTTGEAPLIAWTVPRKAVQSLTRVFTEEGRVVCGATDNVLFFRQGGTLLSTRRPTKPFPDYRPILKLAASNAATLDKKELDQALRTMAAFTSKDNVNKPVSFSFKSGSLNLKATTFDGEEATGEVSCKFTDELEIGFNVDLVRAALAKAGDTPTISFEDKKPMTINTEADGMKLTQFVMSLRL